MAESILTSINLAGGSFNVYYDTVLAVFSISNYTNANKNCPNGWRAAVVISHQRLLNTNREIGTLVEPIAIFNTNASCAYNGTYLNESTSVLDVALVITISAASFTLGYYNEYHETCIGTVIFVA